MSFFLFSHDRVFFVSLIVVGVSHNGVSTCHLFFRVSKIRRVYVFAGVRGQDGLRVEYVE